MLNRLAVRVGCGATNGGAPAQLHPFQINLGETSP